MLEEFVREFSHISLHKPKSLYISNLTGDWIKPVEALDPHYWKRQLRDTVLFDKGIQTIIKKCQERTLEVLFVEVGPGSTLTTFVKNYSARSYQSLPHPKGIGDDTFTFLSLLAKLWCIGVSVDWIYFYQNETRRRLSLPTYPFARQRYWIMPSKKQKPLASKGIEDWFYAPVWQQSILSPQNASATIESDQWLIFGLDDEITHHFIEHCVKQKQQISIVKRGEQFIKLGPGHYIINPHKKADYEHLFKDLRQMKRMPKRVIYFWSEAMNDPNHFLDSLISDQVMNDQMMQQFNALLFLNQTLGALEKDHHFELNIITANAKEIIGEDLLNPLSNILACFSSTINQEYELIRCRMIDISYADLKVLREILISNLYREMIQAIQDKTVAFRGRMRWIEAYDPVSLRNKSQGKPPLRHQGVYVITGGLGAIGLTLAEYLAESCQAKLVFLNRSAFPERSEWQELLKQDSSDKSLRNLQEKINKILYFESLGSEILILQADITDITEVNNAFSSIKKQFHQVHGMIHAAGLAGSGVVQLKTMEAANEVLAPKIQGTLNLSRVFREEPLDFMILCSSIATVLDTIGQCDYVAANLFLDAFAKYHYTMTGINTLSINWDTWQEIGMAVDNILPEDLKVLRNDSLGKGIKPKEGKLIFDIIISHLEYPQIIVSKQDFADVRKVHSERTIASLVQQFENSPAIAPRQQRPSHKASYVPPSNEVETQIVVIWETLLGISPIGIQDNFFEIGGHSILASQMLARLREVFMVDLPLNTVFEMSTISEIALAIEDLILSEIEG